MATDESVNNENIYFEITIDMPGKSSSQARDNGQEQQISSILETYTVIRKNIGEWHNFQGFMATARGLPECAKYRELISKAPEDRNAEEFHSVLQKLLPEKYDFLYRDRFFYHDSLEKKARSLEEMEDDELWTAEQVRLLEKHLRRVKIENLPEKEEDREWINICKEEKEVFLFWIKDGFQKAARSIAQCVFSGFRHRNPGTRILR